MKNDLAGDIMEFPKTFDEFAKDYGFKDKKEIYTNGSELIPVFRVKQWLEHISTTKNDLGVDNQNIRLIDANALIKRLLPKYFDWWGEGEQDDFSKGNNSMLEEVINAIEELPSVTPQPRKGHWILTDVEGNRIWFCNCSECGKDPQDYISGTENWWLTRDNLPKFCPNCGSDNREVKE